MPSTNGPDNDKIVALSSSSFEEYSGPIPPPETLQKFGDIDPSIPERIIKMAELQNSAETKMKNRWSLSYLLGTIFTFLLGMSCFGVAAFLAIKGLEAGTITAILSGIAAIIIPTLTNLKKDK
jgi:uncharacterized membrane protein